MILHGIEKSGKASGLEDDASEHLMMRWQGVEGMERKKMQNVSEKELPAEEYLTATYWG